MQAFGLYPTVSMCFPYGNVVYLAYTETLLGSCYIFSQYLPRNAYVLKANELLTLESNILSQPFWKLWRELTPLYPDEVWWTKYIFVVSSSPSNIDLVFGQGVEWLMFQYSFETDCLTTEHAFYRVLYRIDGDHLTFKSRLYHQVWNHAMK